MYTSVGDGGRCDGLRGRDWKRVKGGLLLYLPTQKFGLVGLQCLVVSCLSDTFCQRSQPQVCHQYTPCIALEDGSTQFISLVAISQG